MKIDKQTGEIQPLFRTMYNYNRDQASEETGTTCEKETRTQQQFKDECDINQIMERFGVTGELPTQVKPVMPDDYDEVVDFTTAMNMVRQANVAFMQMPAKIRERFQNDPQKFTEFFQDEDNRAEATKMGLVLPAKIESPPAPTAAPGASGTGTGTGEPGSKQPGQE